MKLKWKRQAKTPTDRALSTNGAYAPPECWRLLDVERDDFIVYATVRRLGADFVLFMPGEIAGRRFREPAFAKDAGMRLAKSGLNNGDGHESDRKDGQRLSSRGG